MITLDIPHTNKTFYLPEDLSECSNEQYPEVCELIYRFNTGKINYQTFRTQTLYKLLNLEPSLNLTPEQEEAKNANIAMLSVAIDGFFEENPTEGNHPIIKQEYTNNHIPYTQPLWVKYYGPTDNFKNISFGEYSDAINLYLEYENTKDEELLRLIMAIFYRKKRKFHSLKNLSKHKQDVREAYNEDTIEHRAKIFKGVPMGQLYGFYLLLASFHKYLTNCTLHLNGKEINIGVLFQEPTEKQVESDLPGIGLKSIEYQISESGVFGNSQQVRKINLWEIFIRLYDITKRDQDERARQKAAEAEAKRKNKTT